MSVSKVVAQISVHMMDDQKSSIHSHMFTVETGGCSLRDMPMKLAEVTERDIVSKLEREFAFSGEKELAEVKKQLAAKQMELDAIKSELHSISEKGKKKSQQAPSN